MFKTEGREANFLHCQEFKFQAFDFNASQELFFAILSCLAFLY